MCAESCLSTHPPQLPGADSQPQWFRFCLGMFPYVSFYPERGLGGWSMVTDIESILTQYMYTINNADCMHWTCIKPIKMLHIGDHRSYAGVKDRGRKYNVIWIYCFRFYFSAYPAGGVLSSPVSVCPSVRPLCKLLRTITRKRIDESSPNLHT